MVLGNMFEVDGSGSMAGTTAPLARSSARRSRIVWCSLLTKHLRCCPTAGRDQQCAESTLEGGRVLVSSHLIAEVEMFADDLVVVGAGKLLASEPVHTTLARGGSAVAVRHVHRGRRPNEDQPAVRHGVSMRRPMTVAHDDSGPMR